jgi:hypothetical protein
MAIFPESTLLYRPRTSQISEQDRTYGVRDNPDRVLRVVYREAHLSLRHVMV